MGGSRFPKRSGAPAGTEGPKGPSYAPSFCGAVVAPPNPIPKVKVDALHKFDVQPNKMKPSVWLTEVERWLCLCQIP